MALTRKVVNDFINKDPYRDTIKEIIDRHFRIYSGIPVVTTEDKEGIASAVQTQQMSLYYVGFNDIDNEPVPNVVLINRNRVDTHGVGILPGLIYHELMHILYLPKSIKQDTLFRCAVMFKLKAAIRKHLEKNGLDGDSLREALASEMVGVIQYAGQILNIITDTVIDLRTPKTFITPEYKKLDVETSMNQVAELKFLISSERNIDFCDLLYLCLARARLTACGASKEVGECDAILMKLYGKRSIDHINALFESILTERWSSFALMKKSVELVDFAIEYAPPVVEHDIKHDDEKNTAVSHEVPEEIARSETEEALAVLASDEIKDIMEELGIGEDDSEELSPDEIANLMSGLMEERTGSSKKDNIGKGIASVSKEVYNSLISNYLAMFRDPAYRRLIEVVGQNTVPQPRECTIRKLSPFTWGRDSIKSIDYVSSLKRRAGLFRVMPYRANPVGVSDVGSYTTEVNIGNVFFIIDTSASVSLKEVAGMLVFISANAEANSINSFGISMFSDGPYFTEFYLNREKFSVFDIMSKFRTGGTHMTPAVVGVLNEIESIANIHKTVFDYVVVISDFDITEHDMKNLINVLNSTHAMNVQPVFVLASFVFPPPEVSYPHVSIHGRDIPDMLAQIHEYFNRERASAPVGLNRNY